MEYFDFYLNQFIQDIVQDCFKEYLFMDNFIINFYKKYILL